MFKILLCLSVLALSSTVVKSARILAFVPFPSKSHQRFIQPLLGELAVRGHHVTCLSTYPLESPPSNYHAIKIDNYLDIYKNSNKSLKWSEIHYWTQNIAYPITSLIFKQLALDFTQWVLQRKQVQDLISSDQHFDLIIMETSSFQESFIALGHRFNAPVIDILAVGNIHWSHWLLGNPHDSSYIGDYSLHYSDRMTFSQRLLNTILPRMHHFIMYYFYLPRYQAIMNQHIRYSGWENRPPMMAMISNISLAFINSHYSTNYPYPNSPNFIDVGGLNIVPLKPLPTDLQKFMDNANNGVIYLSFGSSIGMSGMLGEKFRKIFANVFSELKQSVLWKWETDFPDLPANVKISKWFPQQDILRHKNMKLFITHSGILSVFESISSGVPCISIPVFADEFRNAEITKRFKYGIHLEFYNITYDSLKWAINEVLENPIYADNAKKRAVLFNDKPQTALETAIYWTEYVIRHKGAHHLRPAIATMPWYQQAMLDVYAAITLIVLLNSLIMYKLLKCIVNCILCRSSTKKSKVQNKTKKNK